MGFILCGRGRMLAPTPMAQPNRLFLSYRHDAPWTSMAQRFAVKLGNVADEWGVELFLDSRVLLPGDPWRATLDGALAGCTLFLCLLCDDYWASAECRRELRAVLERRARGQAVRVAVVLCEAMRPELLRFNPDGSAVGDVARMGDFQFLGPFDTTQRLQPLGEIAEGALRNRAVQTMVDALQQVLHGAGR